MSQKERMRLVTMTRVEEKSIKEAAQVMGTSYIAFQSNLPPSRRNVIVQENLDGSVHIVYRDSGLIFREICALPRKLAVTQQKQPSSGPKTSYIPPPDHPWRRCSLRTRRISQPLPV
jgi:hypothetical protein